MTTKATKNEALIPCIVCGGTTGRAVIYGRVKKLPKAEEVVEIFGARMVLYWAGNRGLFGLAAHGPEKGTRITSPLDRISDTARQVISVTEGAAKKIDEWPNE